MIVVVKPAQFSAPHFAQGIVICRELYAATEKDAMSDNIPNTLSAGRPSTTLTLCYLWPAGWRSLTPSPPAPAADHFPAQPENANLARGGTPLFVPSPRWAWCTVRMAVAMNCSPGAGRRPRLSGRHAAGQVAQTALDNLGKALGESCSAATLDGDNVLYIARAAVNNLLSIDLGRGSRRRRGPRRWGGCC